MLWWPKRVEKATPVALDDIAPTQLPIELDSALFKLHFGRLLETAALDGGIEGYLEALGAKQRGFAAALANERSERLTLSGIEALLDRVFTARRRIYSAIEGLGEAQVGALIDSLVHGADSLASRMRRLSMPCPAQRAPTAKASKRRQSCGELRGTLQRNSFISPIRYAIR
jgi:hypothetical protein